MRFLTGSALVLMALSYLATSQQDTSQNQSNSQSDQQRSRDRSSEAGESSSRDTRIELTPPKDDAKNHPNSGAALKGSPNGTPPENPEHMTNMTGDVQEMHPWNPYRAAKDDEVGDYYLKQGNYKGALARYQDALIYKDNDAVATYRLAVCEEKLGNKEEAKEYFQLYLKILPAGPYAKESQSALAKLEK
jgi:tetratricopeptide (TPR) repeat protein